MDIKIADNDLKGFNDKAKKKLSAVTKTFIKDIVEESNRIESSRNTTGDEPEITSSMVNDAQVLILRGLVQPKKKFGFKIIQIISVVLSLIVGILYNPTKLQDVMYMFIFICVITAAILTLTISIIKE